MTEHSSGQQDNATRDQDNTPLAPPVEETGVIGLSRNPDNVDRTLWYTIGGIVLISCCGLFILAFLFTRTSQFKQLTTFPDISYTPAPTPDMHATERAWRPLPSPLLGSREETVRALAENTASKIDWYTTYQPPMPDVNQPGDIYPFAVSLPDQTTDVIWDYGWCTLTPELLDANFEQMKIEFFLNGRQVPDNLTVNHDYQPVEDYFCRTLNILVTDWPPGTHKLVVDVTFLVPTDDGWNIYPAGTHTFQYYITVDH